jgi:hypothetical protein
VKAREPWERFSTALETLRILMRCFEANSFHPFDRRMLHAKRIRFSQNGRAQE